MSDKTNLLDFTLPAMTEWFGAQGEKPFRARQVFQWIHQRGVADFAAMDHRTGGGDVRRGLVGPRQANHIVTGVKQLAGRQRNR